MSCRPACEMPRSGPRKRRVQGGPWRTKPRSEYIGGEVWVTRDGVWQLFGYLARAPTLSGGGRPELTAAWTWPAFATCTWPFSAGQGCAKVPDYRFIDIKLINYVPYVPIVIARAGYEVYAQMIICQNSIALTLKVVRLRFSAWTALRSARWVAS